MTRDAGSSMRDASKVDKSRANQNLSAYFIVDYSLRLEGVILPTQ
ncbi:hypothetical protein OK016_10035 [Vibrio chagasii]|nr:hypothetical protein [Vibrio chagasii]